MEKGGCAGNNSGGHRPIRVLCPSTKASGISQFHLSPLHSRGSISQLWTSHMGYAHPAGMQSNPTHQILACPITGRGVDKASLRRRTVEAAAATCRYIALIEYSPLSRAHFIGMWRWRVGYVLYLTLHELLCFNFFLNLSFLSRHLKVNPA